MARPSLQPGVLPGNTYQIVEVVEFLQQKAQFSHYINNGEAVNDPAKIVPDSGDIFNYWQTQVLPVLKPILSVGTFFLQLRMFCLNWPDVVSQIFDQARVPGTAAGDPLPPQIAYVFSKATNMRGKSGRGRMFVCGMSENDSTNGEPNAGFTANAAFVPPKLVNTFVGAATGRTFSHVVVALQQYKRDSLVNPDGPPPFVPKVPPLVVHGSIITRVSPAVIWNTQRSRTFGRGQ